MKNNLRIVVTGGPGFGKTSVINALEKQNYKVLHEISREILADNAKQNTDVLPWKNHKKFHQVLLDGRLKQYRDAGQFKMPIFFDRCIFDNFAYLMADGYALNNDEENLLINHSYCKAVFITPPWKSIHKVDKERWESFDLAEKFHTAIVNLFKKFGYQTYNLPNDTVDVRVQFIKQTLKKYLPTYF